MKFIIERLQYLKESKLKLINTAKDLLLFRKCYQDDTGSWNCDKNLSLGGEIPRITILDKRGFLKAKFGIIKGDFTIPRNVKLNHRQIKNLKGMPREVHGKVSLAHNEFTSLKGFPKYVGGDIKLNGCHIEKLTDLQSHVKGFIDLEHNKLTNLEGFPDRVDGFINLDHNKITSLVGLPEKIQGSLMVSNNPITSLEGLPEDFEGTLSIGNTHIRRLVNIPNGVTNVTFYDCRKLETIVDLVGHSTAIQKEFKSPNNKTKHIEYEVKAYKPDQTRTDFYNQLVYHMAIAEIPFINYPIWPEDLMEILEDKYINLYNSGKTISKFNL